MQYSIVKKRNFFYLVSASLMLASLISLSVWGLKLGIDFTGGSLMELNFSQSRPESQEIKDVLAEFDLGDIKVQSAGETAVMIRFKDIDEAMHQQILDKLKSTYQVEEELTFEEQRFESIGPVIGQELKQKAVWAIGLAVVMIILYIAYAFRQVSKPVASWKFGIAAILALIHDIVIVTGLFSVLGHVQGVEIDSLFITALLTILGFSVHDTIVVFDRTRENLKKHYTADFEEVVSDSVNQTITRSINTSVTTLLVLVTMYIYGGSSIANFILALIVGVIIGTYSSIFVASPIIVSWQRWDQKRKSA